MASKALKDLSLIVLNSKIKDERIITRVLEQYPNLEREQVTQGLMFLLDMAQIINDDTSKASDRLKALELLRDTSGQKPVEKQEIKNIDSNGYMQILMNGEDVFNQDVDYTKEDEDFIKEDMN